MVLVPESNIIEKGRLGPGQMIAVDLDEGRFYHDGEIKDRIASAQPYGEWVKGFTSFSGLKGFDAAEPAQRFERAELIRRQVAVGRPQEELEWLLSTLGENAKDGLGIVGTNTHRSD